MLSPLVILLIGIVTVIGMIIVLRVNAFLALISAAMLVSLLSAGERSEKITRVAEAFGDSAGKIGIVIAMAAIIGKCLMDSGAADRIVRSSLSIFGEKRASLALLGSGFVLSIPVFFDTVFYLLVPLARSLWKRTRKNYMLYILAIGTGGAITHTLVPPTPGPLIMADTLGIEVGWMMLVGIAVGLPTAAVGLVACYVVNRLMPLPMRAVGNEPETEPLEDSELPPLWISLMPVILPVLLISTDTITQMAANGKPAGLANLLAPEAWQRAAEWTSRFGNANFALMLAAAIAMLMLVKMRGLTLTELGRATETALMSGGVIILITAGGGAFGAMLREAKVGEAIEGMVSLDGQGVGLVMLLLGFGISSVMKIAQGSGTVAMITTSAMIASMGVSPELLGCNPVYLATAIGSGSLVGSWMNDSGFWIFSRMSGLTEVEALKSWTIVLAIVGTTAMGFTLLFARLMPLV